MSIIISPSILGGSFANMQDTIRLIDRSKAEYIHFDVMDGDFVPNLTFGPQFISNVRSFSKKIFDVHLMINRVGKFLDDYIKAGSDIITFHLEIDEDINELIIKIKNNNIKCGIAIKPATPWEDLKPYLDNIDQIIIMTVEPGFGGQKFMDDQLSKIAQLKKYLVDNQYQIDLEIDGGVNFETGKKCIDAGANILVAGSFLFKQEDLTQATNQLNEFFN
ncbi:ribulose-phosphate 3-epimerase [Alphaproteobacteria bacterium]|jgi:ribulose-phosphate 3-epimerase|nr:ribulose-phosphate 3-epimerase [Alphaproteobacteria bacterium]